MFGLRDVYPGNYPYDGDVQIETGQINLVGAGGTIVVWNGTTKDYDIHSLSISIVTANTAGNTFMDAVYSNDLIDEFHIAAMTTNANGRAFRMMTGVFLRTTQYLLVLVSGGAAGDQINWYHNFVKYPNFGEMS